MNIDKALSSFKEDMLLQHKDYISSRKELWAKYTNPDFIESIVSKLENILRHGPEDPSQEKIEGPSAYGAFCILKYPMPFDVSELKSLRKGREGHGFFGLSILREISDRMEKLQGKKRFVKSRLCIYTGYDDPYVEFVIHLESKPLPKRYVYLNKIIKDQQEQYILAYKERELRDQSKQTKETLKEQKLNLFKDEILKNKDLIIGNLVSKIIKKVRAAFSESKLGIYPPKEEISNKGNLIFEGSDIPISKLLLKELEPYISQIEDEDLRFDIEEWFETEIYSDLRDLLPEYGLAISRGVVSYSFSIPLNEKEG